MSVCAGMQLLPRIYCLRRSQLHINKPDKTSGVQNPVKLHPASAVSLLCFPSTIFPTADGFSCSGLTSRSVFLFFVCLFLPGCALRHPADFMPTIDMWEHKPALHSQFLHFHLCAKQPSEYQRAAGKEVKTVCKSSTLGCTGCVVPEKASGNKEPVQSVFVSDI